MCEIGNKNRFEKQYMPSEAFHQTYGGRVREITAGVRFGLRNLESFDPVTQDMTGFKYLQESMSS
jgi:hypothetical protein